MSARSAARCSRGAWSRLNIDAGPYRRAAYGYRVHTAMIRLAWAAESVADKIQQLPRDERTTARAAYKFLMDSEESAYQDFIKALRWRSGSLAHMELVGSA